MENCRKCNTELNDTNWVSSLKAKNCKICSSCNLVLGNIWRKNNRARANEMALNHYRKNKKKHHAAVHKARVKVRIDMIIAYGGKCCNCGIDDIDVLDIDHIENNGAEHRRNGYHGYNLYRYLKKNNYPTDNYQLLCKNCNWKKEIMRRRGDRFLSRFIHSHQGEK